ncbi:flagellar biosynthetic protein FliQ [Sphingomonas floccifaciens]
MLVVIWLIMIVLLMPMMIISLIIGIVQAATSINEQTLSFVPKLVALFVCLLVFASAVTELLTGFTKEIFGVIATINR